MYKHWEAHGSFREEDSICTLRELAVLCNYNSFIHRIDSAIRNVHIWIYSANIY